MRSWGVCEVSIKPFQAGSPRRLRVSTELTLLMAYLVLVIVFSVLSPYFFSVRNFMNVGINASIIGITATGMTMVLLMGGIDLSVGSVAALVGIIIAILMKGGMPISVVVVIGLIVGLLSGLINGLLITKVKINPLITTLATMAIYRGITFVSTGGLSIMITNRDFDFFGRTFILGIPVSVLIMAVLYVIFAYMLRHTKSGRKVYAVGGNAEASRLSGINVDRVRLMAYTISGLTAAISGMVLASQTGTGLPNAGTGMELNAIAATILGGTSLAGGKGNIVGTFLGVLILSTLSNGLTLLNVPSFYQMIAQGIVLLVAVTLDVLRGGGYK